LGLATFVVAASVVALVGAGMIRVDDVPRNFIVDDGPDAELFHELRRDFASDDNDVVVVVQAGNGDLFTPSAVAAIRSLTERIHTVPGIADVYGLADTWLFYPGAPPRRLLPEENSPPEAYPSARGDALNHPLLAGQLVSADARTTLIVARIAEDRTTVTELAEAVDAIRAIVDGMRSQTAGVTIQVTGLPTVRADIFRMVPREQAKFMLAGAVVCAVIGLLLFRRISALAVVAGGALTGAVWTMGAMGLIGERVNILNSVLPTLILIVGFTDAVHIVHHIRRSRRLGVPQVEAAATAAREVGMACILTSITTMIGFGSLATGSIDMIRRLGFACGMGVGLALFAVLLVVPLLATTRLGRNLHIPAVAARSASARRNDDSGALDEDLSSGSPIGNLFASVGVRGIRWIIRHKNAVCILGFLSTLILIAVSFQLKADSRLIEATPVGHESVRAIELCDEAFGGAMIATVVVDWQEDQTLASPVVLEALQAVHQRLDQPPSMNNPHSVLNLLRALPVIHDDLAARVPFLDIVPARILNRFVRMDLRRALVTVHLRELGTAAYEPIFDQLEFDLAEVETHFAGLRFRLAGTQLLAVRQLNGMIRDLAKSLGLAAIVIFGVMALALRSVRLGLLTVMPNVFPLALTAAYIVFTGDHLRLTSVIAFSVCLGIAVDDTIHFVVRFQRELALDGDVSEALVRTFTAIGTALVTTTCILVGGFAVTFLSELPSNRSFAELASIALVAALFGDLVMLPALLARFVSSVPVRSSG
jgi:hypothetical protein